MAGSVDKGRTVDVNDFFHSICVSKLKQQIGRLLFGGKNCLDCQAKGSVLQSQCLVDIWSGALFEPALLNVFISALDSEMKYTFKQLADDTKLMQVIDTPSGKDAIYRDHNNQDELG